MYFANKKGVGQMLVWLILGLVLLSAGSYIIYKAFVKDGGIAKGGLDGAEKGTTGNVNELLGKNAQNEECEKGDENCIVNT